MLNGTMMKEKSKELSIPFENILSGCLLEEICTIIYESDWKENLFLKDNNVLGLEVYKRKICNQLIFIYQKEENRKNTNYINKDELLPGKVLSDSVIDKFAIWIVNELKKKNIENIEYSFQKDPWCINFQIMFENMYVPIMLVIEDDFQLDGIPVKKEISLFMENNKRLEFYIYSIESIVAENLVEILQQLELLNEMDRYLKIYDILKRESLEGRKVSSGMINICTKENIVLSEKRYDIFKSYRNYSYMKKKWKVLLRKEKRKEPSWEDAFDKIMLFLDPIYNSILENKIFFGDWMPELERFFE